MLQEQNERDSMFGKFPVLMYSFTQFICDDCIQAELDALKNLQNEIGKERILVLPIYDDTRNNRIKLLNMLQRFNYKTIQTDGFKTLTNCNEMELKRFFAFINKEGTISMIFLPESSNPQLTQNYFSEIKKKLKNAE